MQTLLTREKFQRGYHCIIFQIAYKLICENFMSCILNLLFSSDDDKEDEKMVMEAIKKCTKTLGKCGVEQTATLMAWSDQNGLKVDKYRAKVIAELEDNDK